MASTLKPFRQYNEHEVLNMFSLVPDGSDAHGSNCTNMIADGGAHCWDAGRLLVGSGDVMKASSGDWDPVTMNDGGLKGDTAATAWSTALKGYLGANYNAGRSGYENASPDGSHVGLFGNTNATLTAVADDGATTATEAAIGIALRSTLAYDENNEKLLYYTNKQDELQAVLPGDAVPCLRRGLIAMVVGSADVDSGGKTVEGTTSGSSSAGEIKIGSTTAIGEVVAVMDVDQKICLVQIDV